MPLGDKKKKKKMPCWAGLRDHRLLTVDKEFFNDFSFSLLGKSIFAINIYNQLSQSFFHTKPFQHLWKGTIVSLAMITPHPFINVNLSFLQPLTNCKPIAMYTTPSYNCV